MTPTNTMRKALIYAVGLTLAGTSISLATTDEEKCQKKKLLALGKLELCIEKESGKEVLGKTADTSRCQTKFDKQIIAAEKVVTCRWLENSDGTVARDLNTGLYWELKTSDVSSTNYVDSTYTWGGATSATPNGTAFTAFLAELNYNESGVGGCFDDTCDWRLPTQDELTAIVDDDACVVSSDPCTEIPGETATDRYWTSTLAVDPLDEQAWAVEFKQGSSDENLDLTTGVRVRAVRGVSLVD